MGLTGYLDSRSLLKNCQTALRLLRNVIGDEVWTICFANGVDDVGGKDRRYFRSLGHASPSTEVSRTKWRPLPAFENNDLRLGLAN